MRLAFSNDQANSKFEHFTIPAIPATDPANPANDHGGALTLTPPGVNIGLCDIPDVTPTMRVQHVDEVLTFKGLQCTGPAEFTSLSSTSVFAAIPSLFGHALGVFAPQPLHAAVALGPVGGNKGFLSPSAVIDIHAVKPSFAFPIKDGRVTKTLVGSDGNPVTVIVTTQGGTPLSGVTVKLQVVGNSSSIAFFAGALASCNGTCALQTTNATGAAVFTGLRLTKAGSYILSAVGTFDTGLNALTSQPVNSNSFNMQNK